MGVGKNRIILVVDDETDVILTLRTILQESGFEVVSFNDPQLALRASNHIIMTWGTLILRCLSKLRDKMAQRF